MLGRASAINGPLNILGGHHWSNAKPLDGKTLSKIVRAEIGALHDDGGAA
jgi:hypothetical protein